ncbi:MFS transporter [Conexibacter sp. S30A1]|uniref:MFS transporter n=1 Tax=Conexibacter sp. S30A1 TaxID=2937800 RepID=UPI00200DCD44|nr:MFS transporter [Conexibacter sp. S30A1]
MLVAANLRVVITSLSPLLGTVSRAEQLSSLAVSALAAMPMLCFALAAPLAVPLSRRVGLERAFVLAMLLLAAGMLVRVTAVSALLLAGTALASCGVAVANILVPVYIKQSGGNRAGLLTGMNVATMGAVAAVAAVASPALSSLLGGWRAALGVWSLPALLAAVVVAGRTGGTGEDVALAPAIRPGRRQLSRWGDIIVLTASQSVIYYSMLAWLPSVFEAGGASVASAGSLLSVFSFVSVPVSLMVPPLVARIDRRWLVVLAATALTASGLFGMIVAPLALPYLWASLLGLGQGATFACVMVMFILRARTPEETVQLSLAAQMSGFVVATVGPFVLGEVHALTAGWKLPLIMLAGVLITQLVSGCVAGRAVREEP